MAHQRHALAGASGKDTILPSARPSSHAGINQRSETKHRTVQKHKTNKTSGINLVWSAHDVNAPAARDWGYHKGTKRDARRKEIVRAGNDRQSSIGYRWHPPGNRLRSKAAKRRDSGRPRSSSRENKENKKKERSKEYVKRVSF